MLSRKTCACTMVKLKHMIDKTGVKLHFTYEPLCSRQSKCSTLYSYTTQKTPDVLPKVRAEVSALLDKGQWSGEL